MNRRRFLCLSASSLLLLSACASAPDRGWANPHEPPNGGPISGFVGYALMCNREEARGHLPCMRGEISQIPAENVPQDLLLEVDGDVRRALTYSTDRAVDGYGDDWKTPKRSLRERTGDCEDFMGLAAQMLLDRGVTPASLYYLATRASGNRVSHAVLLCRTNKGLTTCADTFVPEVLPLNQAYPEHAPSRWMSLAKPGRWFKWKHPHE